MSKVLMLIKTTGLEYDDRVRKECLSLLELGVEPVIGVLDDSNCGREGKTDYGVRFCAVNLWSRSVFSSARGLSVKTAELVAKFVRLILVERPVVLWIHDFTTLGVVPFALALRRMGLVERIVWDQHELPPDGWLDGGRMKSVIGSLMRRCDAVISANQERLDLLGSLLEKGGRIGNGHVLQNYPDEDYCQLPKGRLPDEVSDWLGGVPYLITQGGGDDDRRLSECVEAVINSDGLVKLVVVGRYQDEMILEFRRRWGAKFERSVFFTGMVPQMRVVNFLDNAHGSIVFYWRESRNSWLCAPNRLYQAIARGIPVLVGCNPPLKAVVARAGVGVVIDSDGENLEDVGRGIQALMRDREAFAEAAVRNRAAHRWEFQTATISTLPGIADVQENVVVSNPQNYP